MIKNRYSTYSTGVGKKIRNGQVRWLSCCFNTNVLLWHQACLAHHV